MPAEPEKVAAARAAYPTAEVVRDAVEVFKALASPVRLSLLHALTHDELTVGDLARSLDLSLSVTSHQLAVLRHLKLVEGRDEGRLTFYRCTDRKVSHLVHDCLERVGELLGMPHPKLHGRRRSGSPSKRTRS